MNGRGGCCITRYSDYGGGDLRSLSYGMSKVDKIMLRFRPIAPKPIASGSGSSSSTVDIDNTEGGTKRRKRKYVRSSSGNKAKKNTKDNNNPKKRKVTPSSSSVSNGGETKVKVVNPVTLLFMPETPERMKISSAENIKNICNSHVTRLFTSGHETVTNNTRNTESVRVSQVTMECVMDTWTTPDHVGLGFVNDQTRIMNLEIDTCPSFVTNSRDMVVWTNKAYKEMTSGTVVGADVTVVNKCNRVTMPVYCSGFTCKMKVTWGSKSAPLHVTAPCDVWRLRNGGYAWRLDVKAALCLGR